MARRLRTSALLLGVACATAASASCAEKRGPAAREEPAPSTVAKDGPALLAESAEARDRVDGLRARFAVAPIPPPSHASDVAPAAARPVIGGEAAARFERTDDGHARAVVTDKRSAAAPASVAVALRASGDVLLEDDRTHASLRFHLRGTRDVPASVASGIALYAGALDGSDVVHQPRADGIEDFVVFETRPAREELVYDVDVSRAAGLRLVGDTLEFLDPTGTPRLRIAPPFAVDARGTRHRATLTVSGCAYDTDPAGPWGRPVTAPGASSCAVHVAWTSDVYPAIVDPAWTTTGSMAVARSGHTATLLNSGKVLVIGGCGCVNAELYSAGTFAATGSMTRPRNLYGVTLLPSGKVLVSGGVDTSGATSVTLSSAELFDGTSTFALTGSMKNARYAHTATLLNSGKVLIAGGDNGAFVALTSAELFDGTSTFANTGSLKAAREIHTATLLKSGKVLVAGGWTSTTTGDVSSAELFDGTSTFALTGSMAIRREGHIAALLNSGKVLIAGGFSPTTASSVAEAELFDGTSTFAVTGSMTLARKYLTAALLPTGQVLVAGSENASASVDLFDGISSFSATNSMNVGRVSPAAVLIPPATVLVSGGYNFTGMWGGAATLTSAELYTVAAAGSACATGSDCLSGVCDDGVCCAGPCNGTCQTCTPGTGACVAVKNASDPDTCTGTQTCDGTGACKLVNGQASASASACASGFASDGVCCDTACAGACDACTKTTGATADGACSVLAQGSAGNPACNTGYACNGTSATCSAACTTDADCATGYFCAANGTCTAQHTQGQTCNVAAGGDCKGPGCRECATGFCVDGVCCDSACGAVCYACTAALKESGPDGTCGPVAFEKAPPRGSCPTGAAGSCGPDGMCSGAGACLAFAPPGTTCGASTTCTGNAVTGTTCNGSGACVSGASVDCSPYICQVGACTKTCTSDSDCSAGAHCSNSGACVAKLAIGASCSGPGDCATGYCADGYCCGGACTGQCEACDVTGAVGTCTPVIGTPHGKQTACGSDGTVCGGACDGKSQTTCAYHDGTSCGQSCANGQQIDMTCTTAGTCAASLPKVCPGNIAACDGTACKAACAADSDCAQGFACAAGQCVPVATAMCDGAHTVTTPSGTSTDCSPYLCDGDHCKDSCTSINDCVQGNACDATGHCVPLPSNASNGSADTGSTGGCAVALRAGSHGTDMACDVSAAFGAIALLGLARRKTRRGTR